MNGAEHCRGRSPTLVVAGHKSESARFELIQVDELW